MRLLCIAAIWAAVAAAQPMPVIPAPAQLNFGEGTFRVRQSLGVTLAPASAANRFALDTLRRDIPITTGTSVFAGLLGQPQTDAVVRTWTRELTAARHPEGYILQIDPSRIVLVASTVAGLYYGFQTLRQLARVEKDTITVPTGLVEDVPAIRYRGLSVDISRGPILTEARMRDLIRTLAEFKVNMLSFYFEHVFPYPGMPLVQPPGTGITPESMKRLAEFARQHHIDLVPQQQTFGHLHHMLKLETYSDRGVRPHGSVLAVHDPRVYDWIGNVGRTLSSTFSSEYLHIGSDETFDIRENVAAQYLTHMRRALDVLRPLNKKLMFWGDMALRYPEVLDALPKGLTAMTWDYETRPEYASLIEPFQKRGFPVFVCTGLSNWFRIYPNVATAEANINGFLAEARKRNVQGTWNTDWNDEGESLFSTSWYPVIFGAAAAWQNKPVESNAFRGSFDRAFHRSPEPVVGRVVERFEEVHALFAKAGLTEAGNRLFWTDPFSASGAAKVRAAQPVIAEIRRLAEANLIDLSNAPKPAVRAEAYRTLELASHRLSYLGMKLQFAAEMAEAYRAALANTSDKAAARRTLRRFSSTNGLIEDLRATILDIKARYREAWLAENQPYWLDNVLLMYDAEALYWQDRARQFSAILQDFSATGQLPPADQLGMVLP